MKQYPKTFPSYADSVAYLKSIGNLKYFGVNFEYYVYNFRHHQSGKGYHMMIREDGVVFYEEFSPVQHHYWREQGF